jgi:DNA-binding MarR family transcriptional regulator
MGWVMREPDPLDARSSAEQLAPRGLRLANQVTERHFDEQAKLRAVLDESERDTLARLLSRLATEHEHPRDATGADGAGRDKAPHE